jgi:hypothetical protein
MSKQYYLQSLDVWGNSEDGFLINNWNRIGTIDLAVGATDDQIVELLIAKGWLTNAARGSVEFDDMGEYGLNILDKETREPIWGLEAKG